MRTSRTELAWAAGFFDGEGCITFSVDTRDRARHLAVSVAQKKRQPLYRFKAAVGFGAVARVNKNGMSYWRVQNVDEVRRLIALLWPDLSTPKRQQAKHALRGWRKAAPRQRRYTMKNGKVVSWIRI